MRTITTKIIQQTVDTVPREFLVTPDNAPFYDLTLCHIVLQSTVDNLNGSKCSLIETLIVYGIFDVSKASG